MTTDKNDENIEKWAMTGLVNSSILHEVRSPISLIKYCSAELLNSPLIPENSIEKKLINKILKGSEDLLDIINATKELLHEQNLDLASTNICSVIDESLILHQERITQLKIDVINEIDDKDSINCSPILTKQMISNLISNSIDAISDLKSRSIKFSSSEDSTFFNLVIRDSGRIDPQLITDIFNPLYTTKGKDGTGIGLFLAKKIMLRQNGNIECKLLDDCTAFQISFLK